MRKILLLLIFFSCITVINAQTYTLTDNDVIVENGVIKSCSYNFEMTDIIIPQTLDGQTVIAIEDNNFRGVFEDRKITSITLPSTLRYIGNFAFKHSKITGINISGISNLTHIGQGAFSYANLKHINLSNCPELSIIDSAAFIENEISFLNLSGCSKLEIINEYAFYSNSLDSINLSGCTALGTIGKEAFSENEITSLNLSECVNLRLIDYDAFCWNRIAALDLSGCQNLKTIGSAAFFHNNLPSIDLSGCVALTIIGDRAFNNNYLSNGFNLPTNSQYEEYGWKDGKNHSYNMGDWVTDTYTKYWIPIPYTLTNDDVVVENGVLRSCSYNFENTDIIIPEKLDGQTVTAIDGIEDFKYVFDSKGITSVKIPNTVQLIGNRVFSFNSISHLDLSENSNLRKIGYSAFEYNNLTYVNLSDCSALDTIRQDAFNGNEISELNLSGCNSLSFIDKEAFQNNHLANLDLTGCPNISSIGWHAFSNNKLEVLDFSANNVLKIIGAYAFSNNRLTNVDLTGCTALTKIEKNAFDYNSTLASFVLPICTGYETYGWRDGNDNIYSMGSVVTDKITYYWVPITYTLTNDDVVVEEGIIKSCSYNFELTDIIIPDTLDGQIVTGIVDNEVLFGPFYHKGITTIKFPKTIQYIGKLAFRENSLINIDLSGNTNIKRIGYSAFYENKLKHINLSGCTALDSIGSYAFMYNEILALNLSNCTQLKVIDDYAFYNTKLVKVDLTGCFLLESVGKYAFGQNNISNLSLTDCYHLKNISLYAFYYNNLDTLDFSACTALVKIGESAFAGNNLTGLNLNNCKSLKRIGSKAFYNNDLNNVDISGCNTLTNIEKQAFDLNTSLHEFILPSITGYEINGWKDGNNNFYIMGDHASDKSTYYWVPIFYTLTDDDVVVRNGVIESCSYNFEKTDIIIPQVLDGQTIKAINGKINYSGIFSDKGITSIQLPKTIEKIGVRTFEANSIIELDLSEYSSLQKIENRSFTNNNIKRVNLTNCHNLEIIEDFAFRYNDIKSLQMDSCILLEEIGAYAFSNNKELNEINLTKCSSILKIGESAFSKTYKLPGATNENYLYNQWYDSWGNNYQPGANIGSLSATYFRKMPEITNLMPKSVSMAGKQEISLTGLNFESSRNNKRIFFNGTEALSYTLWSDTLIKVICPPNPYGSANISISLLNGITYKSSKELIYSNEDIIPVCGKVSGVWKSNKTYLMTCNCNVIEDDTLIIEPGVKILADPSVMPQFSIYGTVSAIGTSEYPITFSAFSPSSWSGIRICGTFSRCKFQHCIVEYSMNGFELVGGSYGCDDYDNSSLIENCIIRNNCNNGIYSIATPAIYGCTTIKEGSVHATIKNCQIYNNGENGIDCLVNGSSSMGDNRTNIISNLIFNNYNGIICHGGNVEPTIINNTIANNIHYGLIAYQNEQLNPDSFKIANNIFAENSYGIRNLDNRYLNAINNLFSYNRTNYVGKIDHENTIEKDADFLNISSNNYHLKASSPCIDSGNNSFLDFGKDMDNKIRIWDGDNNGTVTVDIGAYEFNAPCDYTQSIVELCDGESYEGETTSGKYRFIYQNSYDCDSVVDVTLIVNEIPDKPFITTDNITLTSSSPYGNQWYMEQTSIEGATNQTYTVEETGNYSVRVKSDQGCISEMSDIVTIMLTSSNEIKYHVRVSPIPTTGILKIEGILQNENTVISIFNSMGQQLENKELNGINSTINLSSYEKGTYYLTFNNCVNCTVKIIKE